MLVSFLAALDDGVSYTSEVAEKHAESRKSGGEGTAAVKIPSLASLLGLNLSANGRYSRDRANDQSTESKFVREHTSASLFNRLRTRLHADGLVTPVNDPTSVSSIKTGTIVEMAGQFSTDPMRAIVDFARKILPFIEGSQDPTPSPANRSQRRSMSQEQLASLEAAEQGAAEWQEFMRMIELVENDLDSSPLLDLVVKCEHISGIVTANREFFGSEVSAALVGGRFSLLGKVTAIDIREDAHTPVIRRGALGTIVSSGIVPMITNLRDQFSEQGIETELPDAHIDGPYLQVIPLAIFV